MKPIMKNQNTEHNPRNLQKHSSHVSMSETESPASQIDSFHSPLHTDEQFHEPSKAIVAVDKYFSPHRSSENLSLPATPPERRSPVVYFSRAIREDTTPGVTKVGRRADVEGGEVGSERRSRAAVAAILGRSEREVVVKKAAIGFRVFEVIFCLVSFTVMAADKTQGWTGDSFYRYKEYRYCVGVNIIGFAYSGFQAFNLAYSLATGKHFLSHHMRHYFDFLMDQILAYLLMSASSSAATRVDDWISNWGKDEFTGMANVSIALSFLAFVAFALSSLISGYNLCSSS